MRGGRRSWTAAVAATGAALALLAGCASGGSGGSGGSDGSDDRSPSATSTASTTRAPTPSASRSPTTAPSPTLSGAGTTPVSRPPGDAGFGLLTGVRLASHPGYQRFVLEFDAAVPGYDVRYVPLPVIADPSGEAVALLGDHALLIRLEPSSGYDLRGDPAAPSYTGPTRLRTGTGPVREAVLTGDFEGVLQWALGVVGERPFVVTELSGPPRLVVDVATG